MYMTTEPFISRFLWFPCCGCTTVISIINKLPAAARHGHTITSFDWMNITWPLIDLVSTSLIQPDNINPNHLAVWHLNEAGCKVTKTGNESHLRSILSDHDQNCSVGRWDLGVPVCSVPCLMCCLHLAQRTAARSYVLLCIIFITLTSEQSRSSVLGFTRIPLCEEGKHYLWIVDMQNKPDLLL